MSNLQQRADECVDGVNYEDIDTIGTICHCLDNNCNSANHGSVTFGMSLLSTIMMYMSK